MESEIYTEKEQCDILLAYTNEKYIIINANELNDEVEGIKLIGAQLAEKLSNGKKSAEEIHAGYEHIKKNAPENPEALLNKCKEDLENLKSIHGL